MTTRLTELAWPRSTERLSLRPIAASDLDAVWEYWRSPVVTRWLPAAPPTAEALAVRLFEPDRMASTLVVELDGRVVGDLMLRIGDAWAQSEIAEQAAGRQAEIGYAFHPDIAGHGYATEAATALLAIAFDDLGVHRVSADCFADNAPSWRLMERLGMRREQHLRQDSLHRELGWCDSFGYAMLVQEWASMIAG